MKLPPVEGVVSMNDLVACVPGTDQQGCGAYLWSLTQRYHHDYGAQWFGQE